MCMGRVDVRECVIGGDVQLLSSAHSESFFQERLKSPQRMVMLCGDLVMCRSDLPLVTAWMYL